MNMILLSLARSVQSYLAKFANDVPIECNATRGATSRHYFCEKYLNEVHPDLINLVDELQDKEAVQLETFKKIAAVMKIDGTSELVIKGKQIFDQNIREKVQ